MPSIGAVTRPAQQSSAISHTQVSKRKVRVSMFLTYAAVWHSRGRQVPRKGWVALTHHPKPQSRPQPRAAQQGRRLRQGAHPSTGVGGRSAAGCSGRGG